MSFLKGWRTRLLNWSIVGLSLVAAIDPNVQAMIAQALGLEAQGAAVVALVIATANAILREVTDTPPGSRYSKAPDDTDQAGA